MDTSQLENAAMDLFLPVMESATVLAAHYTKACGRNCITAQDMSYGLMYAARNVTGKHIGSLYPEIWDEESGTDSDSDSSESDESQGESESESPEDPWTKYEGPDETAQKMNECADTWASWIPENPSERALKNAVDKNSFFGRGE
jgi:histone H3/H4